MSFIVVGAVSALGGAVIAVAMLRFLGPRFGVRLLSPREARAVRALELADAVKRVGVALRGLSIPGMEIELEGWP